MAYTVSRPGQVNAAGAADAMFLKVYAGEVLTTFARENLMLGLTTVRTIQFGTSATFPVIGQNTASYHTIGTEIDGTVIKGNEKVIGIDQILQSSVWIHRLDEAMNHFDYRSQYTLECGRALAKEADDRLLRVTINAARTATPNITGGKAGTRKTNANMKTDGAILKTNIIGAAQTLDENFVPDSDRVCLVGPAQYFLLMQQTDVINSLYGGNGSISQGKVAELAGIQIKKHKVLPFTSTVNARVTGENTLNTYFDAVTSYVNTAGIVFHKSAVGTVKLLDLAVESEYSAQRQATFVIAKYSMGHGVLRPECAVELATA